MRKKRIKRRPGSALVVSLCLHILGLGILVMIPCYFGSRERSPAPHQFNVHYSDSEDVLAELPDPQPVEEERPHKQRPSAVQIIRVLPKVIATQLHSSLPVVTLSATFVQSEKADTLAESFQPSMDLPSSETESSQRSQQESSESPHSSAKLIAAKPMKTRSPVYPRLAREKGYQGTSVFIATINPDGTIKSLQLSKTSGHSILDKAAEQALRHWRFTPATRNGISVASKLRIPIVFRLS